MNSTRGVGRTVEDRSRRRARLVLIVGVLIAILAGAGTFLLSSGTKSEVAAPVVTTDVLVAARDLPPRTALTAADLKVQKYPVDIAPPTALTKPDEAVGRIIQQSVAAGEPILPGKFAAAGAVSFTVFPPNAQPAPNQPIASVPVKYFVGSMLSVNRRSTRSPTCRAPPTAFASATVIDMTR